MTTANTIAPKALAVLIQLKETLNQVEELGFSDDQCNDFFTEVMDAVGVELEDFAEQA